MITLLLSLGAAWPCAALITRDQGALASSDAQEVILERTETGSRTSYRVSYDGDAESFGWLIVAHGAVGEGDVSVADGEIFDGLGELTQPRIATASLGGAGGASGGCGCSGDTALSGKGGDFAADTAGANGIDITAEGFAGPYAYQVLDPDDGESLTAWLDDRGFDLAGTATTLDMYIEEGGHSFVVVTLTPDEANTPAEGRTLPPLTIETDSDRLTFPARMALTGMAEELRTTIYVLGEDTAEAVEGWQSWDQQEYWANSTDAEAAYDELLRTMASEAPPAYLSVWSGAHEGQWLTRFDTLALRGVHTVDPIFDFMGSQYSYETQIIVEPEDTGSVAWLLLPLLGMGWARRRIV
jgi:hypothetical protein